MLPHPLTKIKTQKYYQNEPRFNEIYFRDNLPDKLKDGTYGINLNEYSDIGIHCIALHVLNNYVTYFDSFDVKHIPKEIKIFIDQFIDITNIFRIQAYNSVMCGYFCIRFIDFMLKGKTLIEFTNLFSTNNFNKNHHVIFKYFMIIV